MVTSRFISLEIFETAGFKLQEGSKLILHILLTLITHSVAFHFMFRLINDLLRIYLVYDGAAAATLDLGNEAILD